MLRLALLLSSATLAGMTPQALLKALLKTPIPASELPAGFPRRTGVAKKRPLA